MKNLPFIEVGGHRRYLAALPDTKIRGHLPRFADHFPIIPRSQWVEFEDDDSHLPILDQDGHGSCVGHGSCTAFQHAWTVARGTPERFSPNYLYSLVNGGSDNGAVVGEAMDALITKGICLESTVPEGNVIFTNQMPAVASVEATRFKLDTAYRVSTFDEIVTAALMRQAISTGIEIGRNFNPDADGFLPDLLGRGGGHCTCQRLGLRNKNGKWYVKSQNSWGTSWGKGGHFWVPESYFQGQTDHFVPIAPALDPNDPKQPPVLKD